MKQDKRINASKMSWKQNLLIFVMILWCCGSYMGVYASYMTRDDEKIFIVLSLIAYIVCLSGFISFVLVMMRKVFLMKPLQYIGEGARKLAAGDLSVRLSPLRKDGKVDEIEALIEDFNTMAEELSSIEMLKSDFISSVSHELKTPLSQISNYATILQSTTLTEEEKNDYIEQIGESARKLSDFVTAILQLNKLDNQKIQPHKQRINLSEQLSSCLLGFEAQLEYKDIQLEFDVDDTIWIDTDNSLMDIVWNNLISNAIKFVDYQGIISVVSSKTTDGIQITIQDNGCGMKEEETKRIFEKFYQSDASRNTTGNGIGLALVKRIVDLMNYQIHVESILNKGTTFILEIPTEE